MAENKIKETDASVEAFLDAIQDDEKRQDCRKVLQLMKEVTGAEPRIWGGGMVGFGSYHYKYPSGREGDWFLTGFAPRARELTLYITAGFDRYEALLADLGKFKTGRSCLYLKRLADVDLGVLRKLIAASVDHMRKQYG